MSNGMLGGITLAMVAGLINDLFSKLTGPDGQMWLTALKKFLRKENPWADIQPAVSTRIALWFDGTAIGFLIVHPDDRVEFEQSIASHHLLSRVTEKERQFIAPLHNGPVPMNPSWLVTSLRKYQKDGLSVGHTDDSNFLPSLERVLSQ